METKKDIGTKDIATKSEFIGLLELMLWHADVAVESIKLEDENTVVVRFENGYKRRVNIEMDSRIAIVKDVMRAVE